jgi:hypothetical protein
MVNLDSQQELSNALPRIKTWGELRSFLETGAKKGIGEFIATTKRCFDPTSDPLLKDASIPGVIQELVKTLKKSGIPEGKISRLTKDGALEEYIHGGKAVDSMNQTEARAACKVLMSQIAKMESEEAMSFDTILLLFATNTLVQRGDISALRSLEFGAVVDAYKQKPVH